MENALSPVPFLTHHASNTLSPHAWLLLHTHWPGRCRTLFVQELETQKAFAVQAVKAAAEKAARRASGLEAAMLEERAAQALRLGEASSASLSGAEDSLSAQQSAFRRELEAERAVARAAAEEAAALAAQRLAEKEAEWNDEVLREAQRADRAQEELSKVDGAFRQELAAERAELEAVKASVAKALQAMQAKESQFSKARASSLACARSR